MGSLIAAQAYLGLVFSPIQSLAQASIQYQRARSSFSRISQFYTITPEYGPGRTKVNKLNGEVAFENVFFGYNTGNDVLKAISFLVHSGQKTAICGESGVVKSTLIALLMRFYLPGKGHIVLDGEDADEYDLKQLRQRIGYVSQEAELFTGTIAENIRMNNQEADDEKIDKVLKISGLRKFISALPDGINFILDDKGANFSLGQKKSLAFARVLISTPDIMVFDEPTAELDNETAQNLLDNLRFAVRDKTVFIITPDPLIAEFCDKAMFIINGRIAGFCAA